MDASFTINDAAKERKISVQKLNISLSDLLIDQQTGQDVLSFNEVGLNIAEISGSLQAGGFRILSLKYFADVKASKAKSVDTYFKYPLLTQA